MVTAVTSKQVHIELKFIFPLRHLNVSVFFCTQNVYNRGSTSAIRHNRDILINSNEVCIFRSTRDHGMAMNLGRQVRNFVERDIKTFF